MMIRRKEAMSLLIVEDSNELRKLYVKVLQSIGFKALLTAEDGEKAVEIYKELSEKPDIILMDYQMPKKNGLIATKEILEINENQIIIFISGEEYVEEEALSIGAARFELKPINISYLREMVISTIIASKSVPIALTIS